MKVPCVEIANALKESLVKQSASLKKKGVKPKLITMLVGNSTEQLSFVSIKKRVAGTLGIDFEFIHIDKMPSFATFIAFLKEKSHDNKTSGIIVQQPLPAGIQTETIYNFVPHEKEIEGHHPKSGSLPPLGLSVLTVLKYILIENKISKNLFINKTDDRSRFKSALKNKKIVLIGRGVTGGMPIGKTLSEFKINYINVNSKTSEPEQYYKEADIIITAAGGKTITSDVIKPGVILINVGLRHENDKLMGDYDENEIKNIASYYTTTPKGIGPIDVLYLFKNLLDSVKHLQQ